MTNVPLRQERCYAAHQSLIERAMRLLYRLSPNLDEESDLLRLGVTCVEISAQRALAARELRAAIRSWYDCELGDRQIRLATYRAMVRGRIGPEVYDLTFTAAIQATRARRDELLRLRRELRVLSVI